MLDRNTSQPRHCFWVFVRSNSYYPANFDVSTRSLKIIFALRKAVNKCQISPVTWIIFSAIVYCVKARAHSTTLRVILSSRGGQTLKYCALHWWRSYQVMKVTNQSDDRTKIVITKRNRTVYLPMASPVLPWPLFSSCFFGDFSSSRSFCSLDVIFT